MNNNDDIQIHVIDTYINSCIILGLIDGGNNSIAESGEPRIINLELSNYTTTNPDVVKFPTDDNIEQKRGNIIYEIPFKFT